MGPPSCWPGQEPTARTANNTLLPFVFLGFANEAGPPAQEKSHFHLYSSPETWRLSSYNEEAASKRDKTGCWEAARQVPQSTALGVQRPWTSESSRTGCPRGAAPTGRPAPRPGPPTHTGAPGGLRARSPSSVGPWAPAALRYFLPLEPFVLLRRGTNAENQYPVASCCCVRAAARDKVPALGTVPGTPDSGGCRGHVAKHRLGSQRPWDVAHRLYLHREFLRGKGPAGLPPGPSGGH